MKRILMTVVAAWSVVISNVAFGLDLSGYMDMEYVTKFGDKKPHDEPKFDQHHLNLMIQHGVDRYSFFTEIEYEHAAEIEATGGGATTVKDGSSGKIVVERAWAEVNFASFLAMRAGVMLNETLYQQNHYPSIITNLSRPQIVQKIFDAENEGVRFTGQVLHGLEYGLWFARDPKSRNSGGTVATQNNGLSSGGRLGYVAEFGNLSFDVAALWANYAVAAPSDAKEHSEKSTGLELNLSFGDFALWSEYGSRTNSHTVSNNRNGFYSIFSYAFNTKSGEFIPFLMYDAYKTSGQLEAKVKTAMGLTYRPVPAVTFKAELLSTGEYYDTDPATKVKSEKQATLAFIYFYN